MNYFRSEADRIVAKVRRQLIERKTIGAHLNFSDPWILIATWFGSGVFLPASGTWGTIATLPFALPILYFAGKIGLIAFILIVFILGMKASAVFEKQTATHDSGLIVVDEVIGFCIVLLVCPFNAGWIFLAFLLFRGFDTLKPWPISWVDVHTTGAWGVIADDIAAGLAAAFVLWGLQYAGIFG